jgi:hypothetical protein
MEKLLYEEFILLQLILGCCFFGLATSIWGMFSQREKLIRWGLFGFLLAGLAGIPTYYHGHDILTSMKQLNYSASAISSYEADYYTTLIVSFFLGIISIMSLIMLRALQRIPRLFLYPVLGYVLLVILYLGWRSLV